MEQYEAILSSEKDIVLVEQRGLPVDMVVQFKKLLAGSDVRTRIVKKRLLLQTAEKLKKAETDIGLLNGSLLMMELNVEDYAPLKAILKLNKEFKKDDKSYGFSFLGGRYGKERKDAEAVNQLASIPSYEELVGKFAFLMNYPIQSTAAVFDQIAKKKESDESS